MNFRTPPAVHVVVLNWNGMAFNEACLRSLLRSDYPRLVIWFVDNASNDGSPEWVEQRLPEVRVLRTGGNLGWSGGNNVGIRRALSEGAEYVWILNNDVEVDSSCIARLVARAEASDRPAIIGPLIYYFEPRDRVWFEGGEISTDTFYSGHCSRDRFEALPPTSRYVTGCALMVRREVFEQIGLIDERFYFYCEDADFCWRAAHHGYRIDVERTAIIYHKVGAFSGGTDGRLTPFQAYHLLRSSMLFWRKRLGWWTFHRRWCPSQLGKWVNPLPQWMQDADRRPAGEAIMDALWYIITCRRAPREWPVSPHWFRALIGRRPWCVVLLLGLGRLQAAPTRSDR